MLPNIGSEILGVVPTYEYKCENDHLFEVFQKMADDPITACEQCGAPVERVFHPIAVHFKGSGFYTTDYGSAKSAAASEGSDSSDNSDSSKSDSGDSGESSSKESGSKDSSSKAGKPEKKKEAAKTESGKDAG